MYVERLMQSRFETTDDVSRKRGLPSEPTDGLDNAKRVRLDALTPPLLKIPPLPPGPLSYAQLFTLTEDTGLSSFDVKQIPADLVVKIAIPLLAHVNPSTLTQAVEVCPFLAFDLPLLNKPLPGHSSTPSRGNQATKPATSTTGSCRSRRR